MSIPARLPGSGRVLAGRRFANRSSSRRMLRMAPLCPSTLCVGLVKAPASVASAARTFSRVSAGTLMPRFSKVAQPASASMNVNGMPLASSKRRVAGTTSWPMPSPGMRQMVCIVGSFDRWVAGPASCAGAGASRHSGRGPTRAPPASAFKLPRPSCRTALLGGIERGCSAVALVRMAAFGRVPTGDACTRRGRSLRGSGAGGRGMRKNRYGYADQGP